MLMGNQLVGFGAPTTDHGLAPSEIGSLEFWVRADLGVTGASPVTMWADQSGNGRHLGSTRGNPALASAAINGHDAIDFDGDDGIYRLTAFSVALPLHFFLVIRPDSYTGGGRPIQLDEAGNSSTPMLSGDGTQLDVYTDGNLRVNLSGQPATGQWGLVHTVHTSSVTKGAWNDADYILSGAVSNSIGGGGIAIGSEGTGGGPLDCAIAECALFSAEISGAVLTKLLFYFNNRYSLW